jgi:hypothetical protein
VLELDFPLKSRDITRALVARGKEGWLSEL